MAVVVRRNVHVVHVVGADPLIDPYDILLVVIDTHPGDSYPDLVGFDFDDAPSHIDWNHLLFALLPY